MTAFMKHIFYLIFVCRCCAMQQDAHIHGQWRPKKATARAKRVEAKWKAEGAAHPSVFVQQFLPLFPGEEGRLNLWRMNFSTDQIYGDKVCTGETGFVTTTASAPPDFCRHANNQPEYSIDESCHPELYFDQFALERIMLGKWLQSSWTCNWEANCAKTADIVVVPSLTLHLLHLDGYNWKTLDPDANDPSGCTGEKGRIQNSTLRDELLANYWDFLREKFFRPYRGFTPLIVVHFPFTWDIASSVQVLHSLADQPVEFVERVVIASIESNVRVDEKSRFGKRWSDGADSQLRNREAAAWSKDFGTSGPLLITMPYPTSILEPGDFLHPFPGRKHKKIAISMSVDTKRGGPGLRNNMTNSLWSNGGSYGLICAHHKERTGEDLCGLGANATMFDIASNSHFCIEPPGDTLTRSHFYVAVQSGCIPVIFDGGTPGGLYDQGVPAPLPTWWPWRSAANLLHQSPDEENKWVAPRAPFVAYRDFAVVYNTHDVHDGKIDVVQDLLAMPTREPRRFWGLHKRLAEIAPAFMYRKELCEVGGSCQDAFSNLQRVLKYALQIG